MSPKDYLFDPNSKAMNRLDYRPSEYLIPKTKLHFDLDDTATVVSSKLTIAPNPDADEQGGPLILNGEAMKLLSVKINGKDLDRRDYYVTDKELVIKRPPQGEFTLEIQNEINPTENTLLEGLYKSDGLLSTQCEAHGFRRITYYLDRPDVMSSFDVTLEGDKKKYPILLSNGNGAPFKTEDTGNGRHKVTWEDPHLKPAYLFAVVAGDLKYIEDKFTTMNGRDVTLRIFVEDGYEDQIEWAMESVKRSMKWDEDAYGREYDLDSFNIVAVKSFNMGAMENKGLNIFNISILAGTPERTTDSRLIAIEAVIGHEYFHNWSGNRVTVRDWFELTLKEGLTVLRDRQFTGDMHSEAIKTVEDAIDMETYQFMEDGGPSAHPIRPDFVQEFDNIYSGTIYEKGSHVLGMMRTLMGPQKWREAMDTYFDRFDGQAVTCDDFVDVMQEVSGLDLGQFRTWYSQSGTPEIDFKGEYDANTKTYTLTLSQETRPTPDQDDKQALYMPIAVGLIGKDGKDVDLGNGETTKVLHLKEASQTFTFENVEGPVTPSILRGFSAPVKIVTDISDEDLVFRMAHDSDGYNRYSAAQSLIKREILRMSDDLSNGQEPKMRPEILDAYETVLKDATKGDMALNALVLSLPTMGELVDLKTRTAKADPLALKEAVDMVKKSIYQTHKPLIDALYDTTKAPANEDYAVTPTQVGRRALHNRALGYIGTAENAEAVAKAKTQFDDATNMTEQIAALGVISHMDTPEADEAFDAFQKRFDGDINVMNSYLMLQSGIEHGNALDRVTDIMDGKLYDKKVPNIVRAVLGGFMRNAAAFHAKDGSGYKFIADQIIEMNSINPRVGSGLIKSFLQWNKYTEPHASLMRGEIERILKTPDLAMGIKEYAQKALAVTEKPKKDDGGTPSNGPEKLAV